jgi:hypothetical protein
MALPYTFRFLEYNVSVNASSAHITVPAGGKWVLRNIEAWFTSGGVLYLWREPSILLGVVQNPTTATTSVHWEGRIALNPGDAFYVQSQASQVQGSVTGYDFSVV